MVKEKVLKNVCNSIGLIIEFNITNNRKLK